MTELEIFDETKVLEHFKRLEAVVKVSPIKVFAASYTKHPWPYRLQHYGECYKATFSTSQHRILDSGFKNPEITNADVLEKAVQREATEVVGKDYLADADRGISRTDAQRKTTESIQEFSEIHDPDEHPKAWVPLQPPYDEHYQDVAPIVADSHLPERYMLGGLAFDGDRAQVAGWRRFRENVDTSDMEVHGLGWGLNPLMVAEIRNHPDELDSVDTSSSSNAIRKSRVLDRNWDSQKHKQVNGDEVGNIGGVGELWMLLQGVHRLTKHSGNVDELPNPDAPTGVFDFV